MTRINYQQDDATIYRKARSHVWSRLIFTYILLTGYFIAVYFLLHRDFFAIDQTQISSFFLLILSAGQLLLYLILFLMLAGGSKIFRVFYWICFVFELALIILPGYYLINDMSHFFAYAALIGCMLVKLIILYALGNSLSSNSWCRVYFDHVLEIDEDYKEDEDEIFQPIQKPSSDSRPVKAKPEEPEYEDEPYTFPQVSVRLGICIYGSLMLFPIAVQIFSSFFVSNDLQTVFATKDIFILSIVSAVIWTVPVFFLYYDHPYSKRIVLGCILAEAIALCAYLPTFIGYVTSGDYPIRVYILFVLVDLIRYFGIWFSLKPLIKA